MINESFRLDGWSISSSRLMVVLSTSGFNNQHVIIWRNQVCEIDVQDQAWFSIQKFRGNRKRWLLQVQTIFRIIALAILSRIIWGYDFFVIPYDSYGMCHTAKDCRRFPIKRSISPFCGCSDKPKLSLYKTGSLSFILLRIVHRGKLTLKLEVLDSQILRNKLHNTV